MNKLFKTLCLILSIVLVFSVSISCLRSLDNDNSNNSSNENFNQQQEQQVDFSNLTYVAFGDSITAQRNGVTYTEFVSQELSLKDYLVCGYSGYTLCYHYLCPSPLCTKIEEFNYTYDIISLMGGVNDWAASSPLGTINDLSNETVYGALNIIATTLKTKYPNSFVFFMTPYKHIGWDNLNSAGYNLYAIANAVKEVANKYNIPVLDMFNLGQFELEMYNEDSDGCHPSKDFIQNYTAPQIAQFIKDNYKK